MDWDDVMVSCQYDASIFVFIFGFYVWEPLSNKDLGLTSCKDSTCSGSGKRGFVAVARGLQESMLTGACDT